MLKENGFYRGINLGGWLSQCDYSEERLNGFIEEADIARIADWGMDHVRIPVDYNVLEEQDGTPLETGLDRLADALGWCRKYGLRMVIDLHKTYGYSFDDYSENESGFFENEAYQERFCRLWERIAQRFGQEQDVAFELLNEVTEKAYLPVWKRVARECVSRIRRYAPDTLILIGSWNNNAADTVCDLDAPFDDRVVYNMHCYEPLTFTHQGAYWTDKIDPDRRVPFTESGCDESYFEKLFSTAIAKAKQYGSDLYCGEYGVIDRAAPEDAIAWYRTIHKVFEKYGISRSAWTYKELDFGLTALAPEKRTELLQYL